MIAQGGIRHVNVFSDFLCARFYQISSVHVVTKEEILLGKTHMAVGVAASLAVTQPTSIPEMILAVGGGALGAVISDIDVETSNSRREVDHITLISLTVVMAVLVSDYFLQAEIVNRVIQSSGLVRIVTGILLFIGICTFGKKQPHRSFMHSFLALACLCVALGLVWEKIVIYFAVGFLSHLAADIFNKKKVRLMYPLKGGVSLGLFRAHGFANQAFFIVGSFLAFMQMIFVIANVLNT